ncbi:D-glycero-beta-D-manno-heptose 1-phosphate adenylyltransferase [Arthrobacter sp. JSM 101049]|uniref:D-glycero-beta-D-manno-heptose 1-phosphate adenylyltransferase n=1 Tax=Arthrobacter sp. JSM 101049 TaxID=929097 RepID=UPI0035655814
MSAQPGGRQALTPDIPDLLVQAAPRVVVVGDVMLDGWWHGDIERFCREAPAPVVEVTSRQYAPGGGANTAVNAARLGGRVSLVGLVGQDAAGDRLTGLLEEAGVATTALLHHAEAATTTKDRIIGGDQILFRLDDQAPTAPAAALDELAARIPGAVAGADVVVVCDYGSGMLTGPVHQALRAALAGREASQLVVVDAHDPRPWAGLGPDLATPNAAEALDLLGLGAERAPDRAAVFREHRDRLLAETGAKSVVVTLDQDGTVFLPATGPEHRTWARPVTEKQASGAGDTFVACLAVATASGLAPDVALELAQAAATVVVHRPGTSVCSAADLAAHLGGRHPGHVDAAALAAAVERHREAGESIVLTNGCFDVLHRGHTRYLEQAKELGDVLIVALNSDDSVHRLKGEGRPINPLPDRAAVIGALSCVDYVTVFKTDTPIPLIRSLRPDVYAKGGDYTEQMLDESAAVHEVGGVVRIVDYVADHSTTEVLRRMRGPNASPAESGS